MEKLFKWLKKRSHDSEYSRFYESKFGIENAFEYYDENNDIDMKINDKCMTMYPDSDMIKFIDTIPNPDIESNQKIIKNLESIVDDINNKEFVSDILNDIDNLKNIRIYIPPGTNQSNAHFFYKLLVDSSFHLTYDIPDVFNSKIHRTVLVVDKNSCYDFVFNNS